MGGLRSMLARPWVQHLAVLVVVSALLLPNVGMGLYDPWETHYAETARRIDHDGDWITLRWHSDSRLADQVNGRCRAEPRECHFFSKPVLIFWLMGLSYRVLGVGDAAARLPIVLVGLFGLFGIYFYVRRMAGPIAGAFAAAVAATTPFYSLLSRQIMTDIAFVVPMSVGLLALVYYLEHEEARRRHLYLFYFLVGLATLAKGMLGFLLPGAVVFFFLLLSPRRFVARLRRLEVPAGAAIFLAVAGPWYGAMYAIHGETWLREFIVKHHFERAGGGVHGERGGWDYYLVQLGYGLWPWVALVPVALGAAAARLRPSARAAPGSGLALLLAVWAAVAFVLFSATTTKFHHYIFPAVPPLAMLAALVLARLWTGAAGWLERAVALAGGGLLVWVTPILLEAPHTFINLFIYGYDRRYPEIAEARGWLVAAVAVFAVGLALVVIRRLGKAAAVLLVSGALVATAWNVHGYMVALEPTLSQRDAFDAYSRLRQPGDRLYEWALRWRGEVWYSRDEVREIPQDSLAAMRSELGQPGRAFVVTTSPGALSRRTRRLFGRPVRVVNDRPERYAMTLWEGPSEQAIERNLVSAVPESATAVGARLGEAVELAAYEVRPLRLRPGGTLEVVLYFRCHEAVGRDWTVFVHGDHPTAGRAMRLRSDHPPAGGMLPTSRWRPGQIVRDATEIEAREDQAPGEYALHAGLFRDGEGRMPVTDGPADDERRVPIGSVTVAP